MLTKSDWWNAENEKVSKTFVESSAVIRGAMIQMVNTVDITVVSCKVNLKHLDVIGRYDAG